MPPVITPAAIDGAPRADGLDALLRHLARDHAPGSAPAAEHLERELARLAREGVAVPADLARLLAAADGAAIHLRDGRAVYRVVPLAELHWIDLGPDEEEAWDGEEEEIDEHALLLAHGLIEGGEALPTRWAGPMPAEIFLQAQDHELPYAEPAPPWAWLRFCALADGSCLAARPSRAEPGAFEIAHVLPEDFAGGAPRRIVARSFTDFLARALDGGPELYFARPRP
jgi:hypothetical protein